MSEKKYFNNHVHGEHINASSFKYQLDLDKYIGKELTDELSEEIINEYCAHISKLVSESFQTKIFGDKKTRPIDSISLNIRGDIDYDGDFDGFTLGIHICTVESDEEFHDRLCDETKKLVEDIDREKESRRLLYLKLKKEFEK